MSEEAKKFDQGKADYSLLPAAFLDQVAAAMQYGAGKYGRFNYTSGLEASRLGAAAGRHLFKWLAGEEVDKESGVCHLAHVAANVLMLLHTRELGTLKDDRYKGKGEQPDTVTAITLPGVPYSITNFTVDERYGVQIHQGIKEVLTGVK
jgi:hypothetical protein